MRFGVLGPLEVVHCRRPLPLGPPKQRALLAVLLLDANRVVSLDRLIDLLWGDEAPARATTSLQSYVSNLRRILEPDRSPRTPAAVLMTAPPGYLLRIEPDALDAARFETLASDGARFLAAGRPEDAVAALDTALALWRGPVLVEFAYEDFVRNAAVRLDELRHAAREDRVEAMLAMGHHHQAVAELEAMVGEAALRERRWRLLMLALYRCGRQAEALRAYANARRLLGDELGVEPGPALARMESDVLAQAPHLDWTLPEARTAPPVQAGRPPPTPGAGGRKPPLVGREPQLQTLMRALDEAVAGEARVVLVSGEAGIGKTRLLDELAGLAERRGALVAWGRTFEGGATPAFWPWVGVVRALAANDDGGAAMLRAAGPGAAAVVQLVPELADRWGAVSSVPGVDAETARFRLYEAVVAMLRVASARGPVVVLLDDLHWADPATLGVTEFVATQPGLPGVLLVVAYRPEDVADDHVVATIGTLARVSGLERVELVGLAPPEVGRFVADASGLDPSSELVGALHAKTDGNPFFLGELVRLLAAEHTLAAPAVNATGIPTGVRDVVRRRLARLPEASNALLRVAAVIGREFDLGLLTAAAELDEEDALRSVEAALLIGVVIEEPGSPGCYRFAHALVRAVLYEQLSGLRRARIHGRVGRALESRPPADGRLNELAHHFFEAAPADGTDPAITYALRAAEAAQAQLAFEEAHRHFARALELVEGMPRGPERASQEIDIRLLQAGMSSMVGSYALAETGPVWVRIADLCREFGHTDRLLAALSGQWIFSIMRGDYDAACAVRDRVADHARDTGDPTSAMIAAFHTGYLALYRADLALARTHLDQAIALVRTLDAAALAAIFHIHPESLLLAVSAMACWLLGDEEVARGRAEASLACAESTRHPFTVAIAFVNACVVDAWAQDHVRLRERAERGIAITSEYGLGTDEAHLRVMRGWARAREGDAAAGAAEAEAGLAEIKAVGRVMSRPWQLGLLAEALELAGRVDDATAALDEAFDVMEASGEVVLAAELFRLRGELLFRREPDRRQEAAGWLRRAVEVAAAQGALPLRARAEESLARLEVADSSLA